jgi:hypothetical protein
MKQLHALTILAMLAAASGCAAPDASEDVGRIGSELEGMSCRAFLSGHAKSYSKGENLEGLGVDGSLEAELITASGAVGMVSANYQAFEKDLLAGTITGKFVAYERAGTIKGTYAPVDDYEDGAMLRLVFADEGGVVWYGLAHASYYAETVDGTWSEPMVEGRALCMTTAGPTVSRPGSGDDERPDRDAAERLGIQDE